MLWAWLSQAWNGWRSAVHIVKPDTVIAWHRRGFRLVGRWKSRRRNGRPGVPHDIGALIREMSTANPLGCATDPRGASEGGPLGEPVDPRQVHAATSPSTVTNVAYVSHLDDGAFVSLYENLNAAAEGNDPGG
jgi:hypothetical protein